MPQKVMLVVPVIGEHLYQERLKYLKSIGMEVAVSVIEKGSSSIESSYDTAFSVPDTLRKIVEAEEKGYQAVVIDCFDDPALQPAREKVDIPVIGPGLISMLTAISIGDRFTILTVTETMIPSFWHNIHAYGLGHKVASIRAVDIPVLELHEKKEEVLRQLVNHSVKAIKEDGASVLIIGCTGMAYLRKELQRKLKDKGYDIPVIDPILTALNYANMLINIELAQSKIAYRKPPMKERSV